MRARSCAGACAPRGGGSRAAVQMPNNVDLTTGAFVCNTCAGLVRGCTEPHRVKSLTMSQWKMEEVEQLERRGNDAARQIWLARWSPNDMALPDPRDQARLQMFIRYKYDHKKWYAEPGSGQHADRSREPGGAPAAAATGARQATPVRVEPLQSILGSNPPRLIVQDPQQRPGADARPSGPAAADSTTVASPAASLQAPKSPKLFDEGAAAAPKMAPAAALAAPPKSPTAARKPATDDLLSNFDGADPFAAPKPATADFGAFVSSANGTTAPTAGGDDRFAALKSLVTSSSYTGPGSGPNYGAAAVTAHFGAPGLPYGAAAPMTDPFAMPAGAAGVAFGAAPSAGNPFGAAAPIAYGGAPFAAAPQPFGVPAPQYGAVAGGYTAATMGAGVVMPTATAPAGAAHMATAGAPFGAGPAFGAHATAAAPFGAQMPVGLGPTSATFGASAAGNPFAAVPAAAPAPPPPSNGTQSHRSGHALCCATALLLHRGCRMAHSVRGRHGVLGGRPGPLLCCAYLPLRPPHRCHVSPALSRPLRP